MLDAIDQALAGLDSAVRREDVRKAKSVTPAGATRRIVHRDADHRIVAIDEFPMTAAPDLPSTVVESE